MHNITIIYTIQLYIILYDQQKTLSLKMLIYDIEPIFEVIFSLKFMNWKVMNY